MGLLADYINGSFQVSSVKSKKESFVVKSVESFIRCFERLFSRVFNCVLNLTLCYFSSHLFIQVTLTFIKIN